MKTSRKVSSSKNIWIYIFLFIAITFFSSYSQFLTDQKKDTFLYIVRLFESYGVGFPEGFIQGNGKLWFFIARLLGLFFTLYMIIMNLMDGLRIQFRQFRFRCFASHHVLVFGGTPAALKIVDLYHDNKRFQFGYKVALIVTDNIKPEIVNMFRLKGIVVFSGTPGDSNILRNAQVKKARTIYLLHEDDTVNINAAKQLADYKTNCHEKFRTITLKCNVQVQDLNLRNLFVEHELFIKQDECFEIIPFDAYKLAVRHLFNQHPLDRKGISPESNKRVHLLIAGMGNMGRQVLLQALQIGHYANGIPIKISCIDKMPEGNKQAVISSIPEIELYDNISFHHMELDSMYFIRFVEKELKKKDQYVSLLIATKEDTHGFNVALQVRHALWRIANDLKIYVHISQNRVYQSLVDEMRNDSQSHISDDIYPFGTDNFLSSAEYLENAEYDKLARALHYNYLKGCGKKPQDDPWEKLIESNRSSNRYQADHIDVKLRAMGMDINTISRDKLSKLLSEKLQNDILVERLAELEHNRWLINRSLDGYVYGEQKCSQKKVHPLLTDWKNISETDKSYNIKHIEDLKELIKVL